MKMDRLSNRNIAREDKHPFWKGVEATDHTKRRRVENRYKMSTCSICWRNQAGTDTTSTATLIIILNQI